MKTINIDKWGWLKEAIPIFILIVFIFIFFSESLFENKVFVHRDLSRYFFPLREFSVKEFQHNRTPLWNPYIYCGNPHLAELQTCVFYPLSIIYLLFSYPKAFNYFIILHVLLAGVFLYILMRHWQYSRYAAFFSATAFMFSGYIISVLNLLASLASVIWLPLVILFYEKSFEKDWVKNSIITAIFLFFMFLGGEPTILFATFFILFLFGCVVLRAKSLGSARDKSRRILLILLIFLGLSCFQLLPFLEFLKESSRDIMDFREASMWSMPVYALLDLFVPYLSESDYMYKDYWTRQSWLLVYYMGLSVVLFSLISLRFDTTKRRRAIFYILALGLILSLGSYTPIYYFLFNFIPGFRLSRYPVKFFFIIAFSLAILGGMGLDYYRENLNLNPGLRRFLKGILVLAFAFSFFYLIVNLDFVSGPLFELERKKEFLYIGMHNLKRAMAIFMILAVFMYLGLQKKVRSKVLFPALITLSFLDLFTANKDVYLNMDVNGYLGPGESVEFLKEDKALFRIFDSPATLRQNIFVPERDYFEGMEALKERMVSNRGVHFGIYDAYGYGSLYRKRHEDIMNIIIKSKTPDETNLLSLLNVKYIISTKDFVADGYRLVKKTKKVNIYENENFLPRAFLAEKAVVIREKDKILERLKSKDFDPMKEVILEENSFFTTHHSPLTTHQTTSFVRYEPNCVEIETETNSPKFLILSDSYYPGWKVYVDGKQDKIYRADYILRAVHIEPGRHIVRFAYDPFSFKMGMIISLGTVGVILFLFFKQRQKEIR